MLEKKGDRVAIERIIFDKDGRVEAVDLHDEKFGDAIFCEKKDRHSHGKYGYKFD